MDYDLLIKGGRVVDGSGLPGYRPTSACATARSPRSVASAARAARTSTPSGLVVGPGFIDHHTHLDAQILWDPYGTSEPSTASPPSSWATAA